jgi:hypothetical protein
VTEEVLEAPLEKVDLLVFLIGERRFAADAGQVQRVASLRPDAVELESLGRLTRGARALEVSLDGADRQVAVDGVIGLRSVPLTQLRRFPVMARAGREVLGVWLDGEAPVVLIDLEKAVRTFVRG